MVVDTSAIVAYLRSEAEALAIERLLLESDELCLSAFTALECRVVLYRRFGERAVADFDLLLAEVGMSVVPLDAEQAAIAARAYRRYGKGTGHPAQLNLGDCAAYALARRLGAPLLYKGQDFVHTDVTSALAG